MKRRQQKYIENKNILSFPKCRGHADDPRSWCTFFTDTGPAEKRSQNCIYVGGQMNGEKSKCAHDHLMSCFVTCFAFDVVDYSTCRLGVHTFARALIALHIWQNEETKNSCKRSIFPANDFFSLNGDELERDICLPLNVSLFARVSLGFAAWIINRCFDSAACYKVFKCEFIDIKCSIYGGWVLF